MKFGSIQYLYLVWILPAMILLAVYSFRKKDQLTRQFVDRSLWERLTPGAHRKRQVLKFMLFLTSITMLLISLLRPRWGFHWEEVQRRGVDIVVAVDLSESMLAEDIKPNRLERAKYEITDLIELLGGDRIGLVAFAGASFLECPLTLDRGAFKMFLDYLDTGLIPVPGTDIGGAIRTAIEAFVPGRRASRALILITDGEDHSGEAEKQAEAAKSKGIRVFTVGIGSSGGAPIPLQDGSGGFKKDRGGDVVMSRLDETVLQKVALLTGGNYVRSVTGDMDLKEIYNEIRGKMKEEELESTQRRRWEERFQWFLFACILLSALEALLPERKRSSSRTVHPAGPLHWLSRLIGRGVVVTVLLTLFSPAPGMAESVHAKIRKAENAYRENKYDEALKEFLDAKVERPEDAQLQYNIGGTHYRMKSYEDAATALRNTAVSAADPVLEQKATYNLGNCAYRQGKLEEATAFYQKALELDPKDEDARFNLEFVREEIKRRMNQARERQENEQKQEQEKQQQQQGSSSQNPQASQDLEKQKPGEEKNAQEGEEQPRRDSQGQEQEPQPLEAAAGEERKEPPASGQELGSTAEAAPMTHEEAERWLNSLDDEQKELAEQQIRRALGPGRPRSGKDW